MRRVSESARPLTEGGLAMAASRPLRPLVDGLEQATVLDAPGQAVGKAVRSAIPTGTAKEALSGTWLTHAVHPPLTDVVIGSFLAASLVDLTSPGTPEASERLLQLGLAAAVPTALSGANDWADTGIAAARVRLG